MNPDGRVPVLELDDGTMLPESGAILLYLAEGTPYLPEDGVEQAHIVAPAARGADVHRVCKYGATLTLARLSILHRASPATSSSFYVKPGVGRYTGPRSITGCRMSSSRYSGRAS